MRYHNSNILLRGVFNINISFLLITIKPIFDDDVAGLVPKTIRSLTLKSLMRHRQLDLEDVQTNR